MSPEAINLLEQGLRVAAHSYFENQSRLDLRQRHVSCWAERALHIAYLRSFR